MELKSINIKSIIIMIVCLAHEEVIASISHGPMLGDIRSDGAAIWFRTKMPARIELILENEITSVEKITYIKTHAENDNAHTIRVKDLSENTPYNFELRYGADSVKGRFRTLTSGTLIKETNISFGSCYHQSVLNDEKGLVFRKILEQDPDVVIFAGDLPYSKAGRLDELRENHKLFRENNNFTALISNVPIYAIYDDHDFGEDNSDGTNKYKIEALKAFNEYWPNPKSEESEGIYTSFMINNAEVFLLDTRFFSRQSKDAPTILGDKQFEWLCSNLKASIANYKILVSGVSLASTNDDGWNGKYYKGKKEKLLSCIYENEISGVMMISGDSHRAEINRYRLGGWNSDNFLYDFTSSPLKSGIIRDGWKEDDELLYVYKEEDSLFASLQLNPENENNTVIFNLISPAGGVVKTMKLSGADLVVRKTNSRITVNHIILGAVLIVFIALSLGYYIRVSNKT